MDNRERDRMSQRNSSTDAGDMNRKTSEKEGRENSGTGADFGQNIGRSENLGEGGNMENRNRSNMNEERSNMDTEREQSRRPSGDSGFGSSSGRSSGRESESSSHIERGDLDEGQENRSRSGNRDVGNSRSSEH